MNEEEKRGQQGERYICLTPYDDLQTCWLRSGCGVQCHYNAIISYNKNGHNSKFY